MSMIKKLIALTLALAMVLSVSAFAGNYKAETYVDAAAINADCEAAVELMYALDIMKGDDKFQFRPNDGITRAEMAKMIYVILNYGKDDKAVQFTGANFFTDVEAGYWAEGYINYCASTKLIAGRGDGTFDPTANVTTAEAAKMLLTAIGYSAENRGYTGANWDKNVLADAAILGLLDGYKSNINMVAPRQWVAVMVANALDCLTFNTMVPSFSGLLVSGADMWDNDYENGYPTMGQKYYGYYTVKGIMTSANGNKIDEVYDADGNVVSMTTTDGEVIVGGKKFKAAASIEDLGQEFKAIVKSGKAISLRNTGKSVVAEDEVKDVTYELTYGTYENKKDNYYAFTVDGETALVGSVNVLKAVEANIARSYVKMTDTQLKAEVQGVVRNDVVRAIDKDADGDFDYVIYTPVEYAQVTKVATSDYYGDYIRVVGKNGTTELTFNGGKNLYIKDVFTTAEEFAVADFVKFTYNMDEQKYDVEILPVIEFVEFESRKISKNEYTFDGNTYNKADNAFVQDYLQVAFANLNGTGMLEDDFDIVVDGDLLVYAVKSDDNYKSMDEVNAKLAVIIKTGYRNIGDDNVQAVQMLTIDGEINWYAYDLAGATDASKTAAATTLTWAEIADLDQDGYAAEWNQLVIVHTNKYGEVYLEKLENNKDLNLPTTLVDLVEIGEKKLDVDTTIKYGNDRVAADNQYFAYIEKEYKVITLAELEKGDYSNIKAWALINEGTYYDTVVGGYFIIGDADPTTSKGFLWTKDIAELQNGGGSFITVLLNDADESEIDIKLATGSAKPAYNNQIFAYEVTSGKYTLKNIGWDVIEKACYADADGELWYEKEQPVDMSEMKVFGLLTTINECTLVDGKWEIEATTVESEFVTTAELAEIVAGYEAANETNEYTYTVTYDAELDVMVIAVTIDMYPNQEYDAQ